MQANSPSAFLVAEGRGRRVLRVPIARVVHGLICDNLAFALSSNCVSQQHSNLAVLPASFNRLSNGERFGFEV